MIHQHKRQAFFSEEQNDIIQRANIAIVGIGALGTVVSEILVRNGLKKLTLIDRDYVEKNNLARQTLFVEEDIGKSKSETAKKNLNKICSSVKIQSEFVELTNANVGLVDGHDCVIVCTDNLESRFLLNEYCKQNSYVFVTGLAALTKGIVMTVLPDSFCFNCVYKNKLGLNCEEEGILNVASTIIGATIATHCLKVLIQKPEKKIQYVDVWHNKFIDLTMNKQTNCAVCKGTYDYLKSKKKIHSKLLCGKDSYQFKTKKNFLELIKHISLSHEIIKHDKIAHFRNITLFYDGRVIVKNPDQNAAKKEFLKYVGV